MEVSKAERKGVEERDRWSGFDSLDQIKSNFSVEVRGSLGCVRLW